MKKIALVLSILLALAMIGAVFYARLVFDPDEYVRTRPFEMTEGLGLEEIQDMMKELALANHRGDGPCLRYPHGELAGDGEIEAVAAALMENGFADSLDGLVAIFFGWNDEREKQFHEGTRAEEFFWTLVKSAGFFEKILIFLAGDRLIEAGTRYEKEAWEKLRNMNREVIDSVDESRLATLRRIWKKCPACFTFPVFIKVENRVKRVNTVARMRKVSAALKSWVEQKGSLPEQLDDLQEQGLKPEALKDAWLMDFEYRIEGEGAVLRSRGADFIEGGEKEDADIELTVP